MSVSDLSKPTSSSNSNNTPRLGDYLPPPIDPSRFAKFLKPLTASDFKNKSQQMRFNTICQALLDFIDSRPTPCFLLPEVIALIDHINQNHPLSGSFRFSNFEMWLNVLSGIGEDKNKEVRKKLMGKCIPRDSYRSFFPISMGQRYFGTHIVTGHSSPDLDTAVASFWGWVDSFAARIGTGLHIWNLPGGKLSAPDSRIFEQFFGRSLFTAVAKPRAALTLQAIDLISPKGALKMNGEQKVSQIPHHHYNHGIILVDKEGYYLGDWRRSDVEGVRQVVTFLNNCLRWFENYIHIHLISLFAKPVLKAKELDTFVSTLFELSLKECDPIEEYGEEATRDLNNYLLLILNSKDGIEGNFGDFIEATKTQGLNAFAKFKEILESLSSSSLFEKDTLVENRPLLLESLERVIHTLDDAILDLRAHIDKLEVAMDIKEKVLCHTDEFITSKTDADEVPELMKYFHCASVVYPEQSGRLIFMGTIYSLSLKNRALGTVSLRDFCNRDEVKIASYIETISVVDHHKSELKSTTAPVALISDTQSCNTLIAEQQFLINDPYSLGNQELNEIKKQIEKLRSQKAPLTKSQKRLFKRLIQRDWAMSHESDHFIAPEREIAEYFSYLYAILDDTDLLAKSSKRDLFCVAELLNRIKSLISRKEQEVVELDDLTDSEEFLELAKERLLKDKELYSIYSKIYKAKEESLLKQISYCTSNEKHFLFADTKVQNGCARIGQIKLIPSAIEAFTSNIEEIKKCWLKESVSFNQNNKLVELFLYMTSTIAGAKEVYEGTPSSYTHHDQLWFWIPHTERSYEYLINFLRGFSQAKEIEGLNLTLTIEGEDTKHLETIFSQNLSVQETHVESSNFPERGAMATLTFEAGKLNSRKAVISPHLPVLVS